MILRRLVMCLIPFTITALLPSQENKPVEGGAKGSPFEGTLAGRKIALTIPEGWTAWEPPAEPRSLPDSLPAKLIKAWKSGEFDELTMRLLSIEKTGMNATKVRDAWFEHSKTSGTPGIVVKCDVADPKDKTLNGHDLESDFKGSDGKVYAWIRTLNLGKDKVAVLLAEARPLKGLESSRIPGEVFVREPHVLGIQPFFTSFMKKGAKPNEAWLRGPTFEISCGAANLKVDAPKGWEYTRLGPEGSVIWMAPGDSGREYIVAFNSMGGAEMLLQADRMIVEASGGKIFQNQKLEKIADAFEIISASKAVDRTLWNWRRVFQRGALAISILAKVPVPDIPTPPSEAIQKEAKAFFDAVKVGS